MIASSSKLVSRLDIHQKKNRKVLHRPQSKTVVPIVVVLRVDSTTVEVQVSGVTSRVERRRPVVAIATAVVPRRPIAVAGR